MSYDASLLWPKGTKYLTLIQAKRGERQGACQAEAKTAPRPPSPLPAGPSGSPRALPVTVTGGTASLLGFPNHQGCPRDICRGR